MSKRCIIIRPGTVESKYLRLSGIDRSSLPIVAWKGKSRRHHGFGRAPCAWRLEGTHLDMYCEKVVSTLRNLPSEALSPEDERLLRRLEGIISGGMRREIAQTHRAGIESNRKQHISGLIRIWFPWLSVERAEEFSNRLSRQSWSTLESLYLELRSYMDPNTLAGVNSAEAEVNDILRKTFIR